MGLEAKTKMIEGVTFSVTPLPGMQGWRMSARLGRVLGPALGAIAGGGNVSIGSLDVGAVGAALGKLFSSVPDQEFEAIATELLYASTMDNKPLDKKAIDLHFAGRIGLLFKVVKFAIEVNFGDFFAALPSFNGGLGAAPAMAGKAE